MCYAQCSYTGLPPAQFVFLIFHTHPGNSSWPIGQTRIFCATSTTEFLIHWVATHSFIIEAGINFQEGGGTPQLANLGYAYKNAPPLLCQIILLETLCYTTFKLFCCSFLIHFLFYVLKFVKFCGWHNLEARNVLKTPTPTTNTPPDKCFELLKEKKYFLFWRFLKFLKNKNGNV